MLIGPMYEGSGPINEPRLATYSEIGFNFARIMVNWNIVTNPSRGVFNLDQERANIRLVKKYGMQREVGALWAPMHAAGGKKTYLQYAEGCSILNDGKTCGLCGHAVIHHLADLSGGAKLDICVRCRDDAPSPNFLNLNPFHLYASVDGELIFAQWRDCARNPSRIDPEQAYEFYSALAQMCASEGVEFAAGWNEVGGFTYNPNLVHGQQEGLQIIFDDVIVPFTKAFRLFAPNTKLIGIEAQGGDEVIRIMGMEARYIAEGGAQMFDEVGVHYPEQEPGKWNFYSTASGDFHDYEGRQYKGRPMVITEGGYNDWPMTKAELIETVRRSIQIYVFYDPAPTLLDANGRPNANAREVQTITGIRGGSNGPAMSQEERDRGLTEIRMFTIDRMKGKPEGSMPGSQLGYHLSTYGAVPVAVSNQIIMREIEAIDERAQKPPIGTTEPLQKEKF